MFPLLVLTLVPLIVNSHVIRLLPHSGLQGHPYYWSYGGITYQGNGWVYLRPNIWDGLRHPVYKTVQIEGNNENRQQPGNIDDTILFPDVIENKDKNDIQITQHSEKDGVLGTTLGIDVTLKTQMSDGEQPVLMEDIDKETDINEEDNDIDDYNMLDLDVNIFPDVDVPDQDLSLTEDEYSTFVAIDTIDNALSLTEEKAKDRKDGSNAAVDPTANVLSLIDEKPIKVMVDTFAAKDITDTIDNGLSLTKENTVDVTAAALDTNANGLSFPEESPIEAIDGTVVIDGFSVTVEKSKEAIDKTDVIKDTIANGLGLVDEKIIEAIDSIDVAGGLSVTEKKSEETINGTDGAMDIISDGLSLTEEKNIDGAESAIDRVAKDTSLTKDEPRDYFPVTNLDFDFGIF